MPCLKEFQSDYDILADYQKEQFDHLLSLFYSYVGTYVGEDELFGERPFVWNAKKWLRILLKLSWSSSY
jgi:hypothetical protein